jgi:hypothetical protein
MEEAYRAKFSHCGSYSGSHDNSTSASAGNSTVCTQYSFEDYRHSHSSPYLSSLKLTQMYRLVGYHTRMPSDRRGPLESEGIIDKRLSRFRHNEFDARQCTHYLNSLSRQLGFSLSMDTHEEWARQYSANCCHVSNP